eukprot:gnl/MRDRNA2_/MRDRNA2_82524_c0_seq1.p1 gnl/MRDRNA2_/MRDRNA2_82524_c0~~gnl/MRDRNA2_/MRDRNA2_82524_c0_seq1.p1  ORF type:complete len:146 (-),score=14.72 gnl/MRDRNA2_/MRDRNA2_82524_c0_seq1:75-512(-)
MERHHRDTHTHQDSLLTTVGVRREEQIELTTQEDEMVKTTPLDLLTSQIHAHQPHVEVYCSLGTVEAISKIIIIVIGFFNHSAFRIEEGILCLRHKLGDIANLPPNGLAKLFKRVHVFVKDNPMLLKNQHGSRNTAAGDTLGGRH